MLIGWDNSWLGVGVGLVFPGGLQLLDSGIAQVQTSGHDGFGDAFGLAQVVLVHGGEALVRLVQLGLGWVDVHGLQLVGGGLHDGVVLLLGQVPGWVDVVGLDLGLDLVGGVSGGGGELCHVGQGRRVTDLVVLTGGRADLLGGGGALQVQRLDEELPQQRVGDVGDVVDKEPQQPDARSVGVRLPVVQQPVNTLFEHQQVDQLVQLESPVLPNSDQLLDQARRAGRLRDPLVHGPKDNEVEGDQSLHGGQRFRILDKLGEGWVSLQMRPGGLWQFHRWLRRWFRRFGHGYAADLERE